MTTNTKKAYGVGSYEISILPSEMEMIVNAAHKCEKVLANHASDKKKIYLDDDDVEVILAILSCISVDYDERNRNSIEIMLEMRHNQVEDKKEADEAEMLCVK